MAAVAGAGSGDEIRLEEGFTPAVAGTVDQHVVTATQGAAAAGFPVAPDGVDPLSAAIAGKMVTWPAELETAAGLTGQKAGHLGRGRVGDRHHFEECGCAERNAVSGHRRRGHATRCVRLSAARDVAGSA